MKELRQNYVKLEAEKAKFALEKESLKDRNAQAADLVTLDISGQITIKVSRSVLTRVKGSALEGMFSGRHTLTVTEKGAIFIDRDADVFQIIIGYLRNGCRVPQITDEFLRERFEIELDFWGLEDSKTNRLDQLAKIFNSTPNTIVTQKVIDIWTKAGSIDLH